MNPVMTLRLWGVRGSIPSPGESTAKFGGNTPCVSIEIDGDNPHEQRCLVLDAGTGIRNLGKYLANKTSQVYVLLTHEHWDHIQGFPFFLPIYQDNRHLIIFPVERGVDMLCSLVDQMDGAHFPVTYQQLPSLENCLQKDPMQFLTEHGFAITRHRTNHPGKCYGYRIDRQGRSIVFIPDNELNPPAPAWTTMDQLADFCRGADVLMHDSQFLPSDMPMKKGWGHSLIQETCELAARAKVKHLILFHHDPERTDSDLDQIERDCRKWMTDHSPTTRVSAGREGMVIEL